MLTTPSTDCGGGSTVTHRFTVWLILHCRCCRNHGFRLGFVGFRGVVSNCWWLPSLLFPKVATCPLVLERGGMIPLTGLAPTAFKTRALSAPKIGVRSGQCSAPATLRQGLLFARGKALPPAGFLSAGAYRSPFIVLSLLRGVGVFAAAHRPSFVRSSLRICSCAPYFSPKGLAVGARSRAPVAPSTALTPSPSSGAPSVPAPSGRAPPSGRGFGRAVSRLKGGAFLSATALICVYQNNSSKLEPFFSSATVFQFCPIILIFD